MGVRVRVWSLSCTASRAGWTAQLRRRQKLDRIRYKRVWHSRKRVILAGTHDRGWLCCRLLQGFVAGQPAKCRQWWEQTKNTRDGHLRLQFPTVPLVSSCQPDSPSPPRYQAALSANPVSLKQRVSTVWNNNIPFKRQASDTITETPSSSLKEAAMPIHFRALCM